MSSAQEIAKALVANPKIMNIIKSVFPTGGSIRSVKEFAGYVAEMAHEITHEIDSYQGRKP
jgi:hypothetical protein